VKAPLTMPTHCFNRQQFEVQRVDFSAPEASGRMGGVQSGTPRWAGVWTMPDMLPSKSDEIRAFVADLRGQTRRFLAHDQKRTLPKTYPGGFGGMTRAGGGAFDGAATSWSESINGAGDSALTLNGMPAAFALVTGDYIGFRYTATETSVAGLTWHALVRVLVGAVANGSGVLTVTVNPPLPLAVPGGAVAYLDTPKCVMVLLPEQSNLEAIDRREAIRGGQIAGVQDIRR
jgi:hypothetical protein